MRRSGAVLGLLPLLLIGAAGTAQADAPTKTGWWNAASANGVSRPMPTTSADDLHVGQGANGPTAYAAVAYPLLGQGVSGATLQLKVAASSAVGTLDVMACPTKNLAWKAGGNQPYDARPTYDCAKGIAGVPAADGSSVAFLLDAAQQVLGGYSLAIVPAADAKPFDVDFVKPDATSLTPQVDSGYTAPNSNAATPPYKPPPPPAAVKPPPAGVSGSAPLSAAVTPVAPAVPLQAPAVAAPVGPAPAPAVAAPPTAPVAVSRPALPISKRDRYAAGTGLALLVGFLVWAYQQSTPEPRLLGGMARKAGPAALAVSAAPRGIGRFSTSRTAPARPLL
ncbi:MAG: hypothetical protein NVS3B26_05530 [Mycobacteriales bacterium]